MQEKKSYLEKMADQLKKLDKDLDVLRARSNKFQESSRQEIENSINNISQKRKELEQKLKDSQSNSAEAWNILKEGIDNSYNAFSTALSEAIKKFKN